MGANTLNKHYGSRPGTTAVNRVFKEAFRATHETGFTEIHGASDLFTQVDGTQYDCVVTMGSDLMNPSIEFIPVKTQELEPGLA